MSAESCIETGAFADFFAGAFCDFVGDFRVFAGIFVSFFVVVFTGVYAISWELRLLVVGVKTPGLPALLVAGIFEVVGGTRLSSG